MPPLIVRLLLDARTQFAAAADAIPGAARDTTHPGLNAPGWILAHAASFFDVWISVDAQGHEIESCDRWLLDWFRRQKAAGDAPIETDFVEARAALDRTIESTTPFLQALTDVRLDHIPNNIVANGWPEGTTAGYLVAHAIAHLFAHAADLNVVAVAGGARDVGLPGRLVSTLGR
jgi:hypothetical protein